MIKYLLSVLVLSQVALPANAYSSKGVKPALARVQDGGLDMYTSQSSSYKSKPASPLYSSPAVAFGVGSLAPGDYDTENDSIPSFRMPNGLLSPQTVMRMEAWSSREGACENVERFLETYRSRGPMACLSYLSDPVVLPELTRALRETSM